MLAATLFLAVAAAVGGSPSVVIYPPQQLPLTFSHARHAAKKIGCDFCHDQAARSRRASDNLLPAEEVCGTCHVIDREHPERDDAKIMGCKRCHPTFVSGQPPPRSIIPTPPLKFDHSAHAQQGIDCLRCHAAVERVELATRAQLPAMASCLEGHDSRRAPQHAASRCATCHLARPDGTLETNLPGGPLTPSGALRGDAHGPTFRSEHGAAAGGSGERYCASCHRKDFCLECHNGVVKPLDIHGNDYVSRHAIDARKEVTRCQSCHRAQSFCLACHERLHVTDLRSAADSAFVPNGTKLFHPTGWADASAAGQPNHHKWQAERNLRQCVSCHREETCLQCHARTGSTAGATGKMWVNPHPPDWRGSSRCQALADRNVRVCLRCHAADAPLLHCR
jgi:hypothetical protein